MAICFLAFCLETALLKALRPKEEAEKQNDVREKELREALSAHSLDAILTSLDQVRLVELEVAGKRFQVITEPDKVASAVFRPLEMSSPRRVTEVDSDPDPQEAAPA